MPDNSTGLPSPMSITRFGYVVHLLEDLGAPAHVRNDAHLCLGNNFFNALLQAFDSCDPFHLINNGVSPAMPTGPSFIDTSGFTSPQEFFVSLQSWVAQNYYADHTAFALGMPGPATVLSDNQYFYGACIPGVSTAATCKTIQGQAVRKIAHKGPLYWASCIAGYIDQFAGIDMTIAQEQYAELGPVIVQQVAAFTKFYAPALTVQLQGSGGTGTVTSSPGTGIDCGTTCSALFVNGSMVTLTATDTSTAIFSGGGQGCIGTAKTVTVTLTADMTCVANFSLPNILTVQKGGNGTGTVTSSPAGINCGTACLIQSAPFNGTVQLNAMADSTSSFTSWSGDCSGTALTTTISVTTSNKSCIATFSATGMLTIT